MIMDYAGALIATALLAMDPVFVITTVLDWGIDAVRHFLAAAAMLLFVLFHRRGDAWLWKAGCFLSGLGRVRGRWFGRGWGRCEVAGA